MSRAQTDATLRSDWHRVGAGLSVRFELRGERFEADWRPRLPTKREFRRILDAYRSARDQFIAEVARIRHQNVMLVETWGDE